MQPNVALGPRGLGLLEESKAVFELRSALWRRTVPLPHPNEITVHVHRQVYDHVSIGEPGNLIDDVVRHRDERALEPDARSKPVGERANPTCGAPLLVGGKG